jgi:LPXTG-motif cell wall-anchored protein
MRWFKTVCGLLVIMLLMASCIRVDVAITVDDDGSGSVDFLSALNTEALTGVLGDFDISESDLGETAELCDGFETEFFETTALPVGATVTPYDEDGFCGTRVEYDLDPSLDQSTQLEEILDPSTRLYKEGDNWFFETEVDTEEITSGAGDAPPAMFNALFADASFTITVDLPGRAVEGQNNATEVSSDGKFTWNIDILNPPARLFAQTEPGSGGGSGDSSDSGDSGISPLLIAAAVALLAAAIGFFLWKRKNDAAAPALDARTPPAGAAMPHLPLAQPGATSTMPVVDGPAIIATPPAGDAMPVVPQSDAVKETIVLNNADIAQPIQDTIGDPGGATAAAATSSEPVFDEALNAWTVDDPARGLLRHDPLTDTWNPA